MQEMPLIRRSTSSTVIPLHQFGDGLEIAVASAGKFYVLYDVPSNSTSIRVEQVPFVLYR